MYFVLYIWFTDMLAVVSELLERGVSINLYMFHGGTSFGFMNGAMDYGTYKPQISSYGCLELPISSDQRFKKMYDSL